jgi:hypothetical protein
MAAIQYRGVRLALVLALVLSLGLGLTESAYAQDVAYGDTVAQDQVVDNDIVLRGDQVTIDGEVLGDVLAISRDVTVNGKIQGSLIVLGEKIEIGGSVGGSVYATGVTLTLVPEAAIQRNLFFVGVNLAFDQGATIGRDLYAISMGARMAGTVGRNTTAVIGLIEIVRSILQGLNVQVGSTPPSLALSPTSLSAATAGMLPAAWYRMDGFDTHKTAIMDVARSQPAKGDSTAEQAGKLALGRLRELVGLLVIGLFMIWLFPLRLNMWSERVRAHPLRAAGSGILTLITGFAVTVILVVVIAGIALGLNAITLQNLAFIFGTLALLAVGLAFFVFWLFAAYISKVIVSYLVGRLILKRLAPRSKSRFWPLLLGLVLYILVTAIPYAGWIIGFFVTLIGLGAVWLVYIDWRSVAEAPASQEAEQGTAILTAEAPADAGAETPPVPEE